MKELGANRSLVWLAGPRLRPRERGRRLARARAHVRASTYITMLGPRADNKAVHPDLLSVNIPTYLLLLESTCLYNFEEATCSGQHYYHVTERRYQCNSNNFNTNGKVTIKSFIIMCVYRMHVSVD